MQRIQATSTSGHVGAGVTPTVLPLPLPLAIEDQGASSSACLPRGSLVDTAEGRQPWSPASSGQTGASSGLYEANRSPSLYVGRPRAVFLDAAGTLLQPSEDVASVYLRYSRPHGITLAPEIVLKRFRAAYNMPWRGPRYVGDARDFWTAIVAETLGVSHAACCDDIYDYYARPEAWIIVSGAATAIDQMRAAGIKVAIVSNFDSRLRPILAGHGLAHRLDAIIVSCEVGAEKPNPIVFEAACSECSVEPTRDVVLHVGDDRRNDVWGARACGLYAWLWGDDVTSFQEVAARAIAGDLAV